MLVKKSLLSLLCLSLSSRNSIPSVMPICIRTRRKTHILVKVALSTSNSSYGFPNGNVNRREQAFVGQLAVQDNFELPVPLNSSK